MSQKRMGPAPFASFEDLSDEVRPGVESPMVARLPDIRECPTQQVAPGGGGSSVGGSSNLQTPSTPRIDISRASSSSHHEEDSRGSTPERELFEPTCSRLGLAFKEDGAMELRSSTEELDFQEPQQQHHLSSSQHGGRRSPAAQGPADRHSVQQPRKDSQGSELGLLSVSGRTSRLSSIGSQGSRLSNASHLSGMSRSPSPHKMLLETSFCGTKPAVSAGTQQTSGASVMLEQVLLARKHDPTEAVLAEGISIDMRKKLQVSPKHVRPTGKPPPAVVAPRVTIEPSQVTAPMSPGKTIVADSGVEYTFIPLKGPLPAAQVASRHLPKKTRITLPAKASSGPEYIRIKLKPDHLYTEGDGEAAPVTESPPPTPVHKPVTLNLNNGTGRCSHQRTVSTGSPKLPRLRETIAQSRTPSPSVSRKSSFTSLFRSKEAIMSPESPGCDRSRSKSREREHRTGSSMFGIFKPKKSCAKKQPPPAAEVVHVTSPLPSLEFTFNSQPPAIRKYRETPLEGDSIRIPLHSPTEVEEPAPLPPAIPPPALPTPPAANPRHSSTSSDNIVFTTNLGSNNDIFTTKLPKERVVQQLVGATVVAAPCSERRPPVAEGCPQEEDRNEVVESARRQAREEHVLSSDNESENESEREPVLMVGGGDKQDSDEPEMKTLVFQQDSFEDEDLPYIPTTLPLERSMAIPIVPVKQRAEYKMCPIERPRSTTPINPNCLDDYCEDMSNTVEPKMRISLPKEELQANKAKSPRRWADFAERDMGKSSSPPPPPLPPRGAPKDWINFEEVPERRKPPKRIQIIPSSAGRTAAAGAGSIGDMDSVIYSYVNPEDCKCECHEMAPSPRSAGGDPAASQSTDAFPHHNEVSSSS